MVRVDTQLREIGRLSLDEFKTELRQIALAHPTWWNRHSSEEEIRGLFDGCSTFAKAIDDIGVLDPPGKERLPGHSDIIVDLRERAVT